MIIDTEKEKSIFPIRREVTVPLRKTVTERIVQKDYNTQMVRELQLNEGPKDLDLKERFIKTF